MGSVHLKGAPLDLKRVPLDQCQGDLTAGPGDDALERGTGDAHALGGLGLGQALHVGQAQCLLLLVEQLYAPQCV
jgi:hypothetical protein